MTEEEFRRGPSRDVVEVSFAELERLREVDRAARELVLHDCWTTVQTPPEVWRRLVDALWPGGDGT